MFATRLITATALVAVGHCAHAHGIAGNRYFTGTLSFDDPAVADELIVPSFSSLEHPAGGTNVLDDRFDFAFVRLLTKTLAVGIDTGWTHRNWGTVQRYGFDQTNVTLKSEVYRNDLHEALVSAALTWGIGRSGAQGIGANAPDTIQPGIFFGKGFGDLPDNLSWLRPLGIAGSVTAELPTSGTSTNFGIDSLTGRLGPMPTRNVDSLHWGFAIEYSTLYLTSRFTPGRLPKDEPLNQFVPLVEFTFDSRQGQKTSATMNPGLSYVGVTWQVAAEAIVPLNSQSGRGVGFRTQLLFFLDDLIPSVFGKPLLTR